MNGDDYVRKVVADCFGFARRPVVERSADEDQNNSCIPERVVCGDDVATPALCQNLAERCGQSTQTAFYLCGVLGPQPSE